MHMEQAGMHTEQLFPWRSAHWVSVGFPEPHQEGSPLRPHFPESDPRSPSHQHRARTVTQVSSFGKQTPWEQFPYQQHQTPPKLLKARPVE